MPRRDYDSDLDRRPRRRRRPQRRRSDNRGVVIAYSVVFGVLFLGAAGIGVYVLLRAQPEGWNVGGGAARTDLERLAGTWETTFRDPAGRVSMHKVKVITGTTETASWYRPDGSAFRVNRVEFALDVRDSKKVFRYFNGWVVDGPGAGQPFPSGEYVYTLEGDTWTEFEPSGGVIVWTRRR
jgi:hypothetical protein